MIRINTEVTGWGFIHIQYLVKEKVILKKKTLIWFFITYFEKLLLIICSIITPVYVPWTSIFRERVRWSIHYYVGESCIFKARVWGRCIRYVHICEIETHSLYEAFKGAQYSLLYEYSELSYLHTVQGECALIITFHYLWHVPSNGIDCVTV